MCKLTSKILIVLSRHFHRKFHWHWWKNYELKYIIYWLSESGVGYFKSILINWMPMISWFGKWLSDTFSSLLSWIGYQLRKRVFKQIICKYTLCIYLNCILVSSSVLSVINIAYVLKYGQIWKKNLIDHNLHHSNTFGK